MKFIKIALEVLDIMLVIAVPLVAIELIVFITSFFAGLGWSLTN